VKIAFLGSKKGGLAVLEALLSGKAGDIVGVFHPDDASDPRSELGAFERLAHAHGIPFKRIAPGDAGKALAAAGAELVLVSGWYRLIPVQKLKPMVFLAIHYSPLPRYRGNAPLVWQILNGEKEGGVSLFRMGEGMDDGDILGQTLFPIGPEDTIREALEKAQAAAASLVAEVVLALIRGAAKFKPQNHALASYCGLRIPEDGRIDWTGSASRIHDFVRSQAPPYPGAFTMLPNGGKLFVLKSRVHPAPYFGVPGAVAERQPGRAVVTCGEGALEILEAALEGSAPIPPEKALDSLKIRLS